MKKFIIRRIKLCLVPMLFISLSHAQQSNASPSFSSFQNNENEDTVSFEKRSLSNIPVNDINIRAMRDFTHSFKNAENIQWSKIKDGLMVRFTENTIVTKVYYGSNGNQLCSIRSYEEVNLPKDIRARVKSVFYDFSIAWVNEITVENNTVFMVQMQDSSCWKTVVVSEDEMKTVKEFKKI
jgi:hypothetical protein